jgi:hypothetical protein
MSDATKPKPGDLSIDVTDLVVYDLTAEQISTKTKVRPGFDKAVECLGRLKPEQIKQVGLSADDIERSGALLIQYNRADEVLPAVDKLAELLRETKIETGHQIGIILGDSASHMRRRAERDAKAAEIMGTLADLLNYVSAPANKAVATRNKAAAEEAPPPAQPADPAAVPAPAVNP